MSLTALSSTDEEFIATVTAAKMAKYIRSILYKLGFKQSDPMPIYEDKKPTIIDIVASQKPIEQMRHIDIQFFAIQDWIHKLKDTQLFHIPGVINSLDDLATGFSLTTINNGDNMSYKVLSFITWAARDCAIRAKDVMISTCAVQIHLNPVLELGRSMLLLGQKI